MKIPAEDVARLRIKRAKAELETAEIELAYCGSVLGMLPDVLWRRLSRVDSIGAHATLGIQFFGDMAELRTTVEALPPTALSYAGTTYTTGVDLGPRDHIEKKPEGWTRTEAGPLILRFGPGRTYDVFQYRVMVTEKEPYAVEWWTMVDGLVAKITFVLPYVLCDVYPQHEYQGNVKKPCRYKWNVVRWPAGGNVIDWAGGSKGQGEYWNKNIWWASEYDLEEILDAIQHMAEEDEDPRPFKEDEA